MDFRKAERGDLAAAALIYESFPEYYDLIPLSRPELLALIADHIGVENSELSRTVVAVDGSEVVGVYAEQDSNSLKACELICYHRISKALSPESRPRFRERLEAFRKAVPPVPKDSCHLTRFAVAKDRRGTGLATELLQHYADTPTARHYMTLSLHVRADNERAIRFYRKCNFVPLAQTDRYVSMVVQ